MFKCRDLAHVLSLAREVEREISCCVRIDSSRRAGSFNKRLLSQPENVQRGVHVAVKNRSAVATRPLSYSKTCDTFRPLRWQRATRRTGLGSPCLVHLNAPAAIPNGLVRQLRCPRRWIHAADARTHQNNLGFLGSFVVPLHNI